MSVSEGAMEQYRSSAKNLEIERLRGVAIIMTTVAHGIFTFLLPDFMKYSFTGVDLFFAISGFVVTTSFLNLLRDSQMRYLDKKGRAVGVLMVYFIKRVFRILPLSLLWLGIYVGASSFFARVGGGGNFGDPAKTLHEALGVLTGIYNYLVAYGFPSSAMGFYWSLAVEEQFYFLLPFILLFVPSRPTQRKLLLFIFIFFIVGCPLLGHFLNFYFFDVIFKNRYFTLLGGVFIALNFDERRGIGFKWVSNRKSNGTRARAVVGCMALGLIAFIWVLHGVFAEPFRNGYAFIPTAVGCWALVFLAGWRRGWVLSVPILKDILEYVGSRSYGIYLSHFAFVRLKPTLLTLYHNEIPNWVAASEIGFMLQDLCLWAVMLLVCEIIYRSIELPLIRFGGSLINRLKFSRLAPPTKKEVKLA